MSDIGLWPSIDYAKAANNVKIVTVMCGTVKENYNKVTGW